MAISGLAFTILPVDLEDPVVALLARHVALDILPATEMQKHMGLDKVAFSRVMHDPGFERMVQVEQRRLLTLEGMREVNDWKALVLEGVYFDRLKDLAMGGIAGLTPNQVLEAVKITRRPPEKKSDPGGGGASGPLFAININLPGEAQVQVRPMPVIEGVVS